MEVGHDVEPGKPWDVFRGHDVKVGDLVPQIVGDIGLARTLNSVQAFSDRPVAYAVKVDLESMLVEGGGDPPQLVWVDEGQAGAVVRGPERAERSTAHLGLMA